MVLPYKNKLVLFTEQFHLLSIFTNAQTLHAVTHPYTSTSHQLRTQNKNCISKLGKTAKDNETKTTNTSQHTIVQTQKYLQSFCQHRRRNKTLSGGEFYSSRRFFVLILCVRFFVFVWGIDQQHRLRCDDDGCWPVDYRSAREALCSLNFHSSVERPFNGL